MDVLVSGSSGLIGTALRERLHADGHRVVRLVRRPTTHPDEVSWDIAGGRLDADRIEGVDAVVHLAGAPLAGRRWTEAYKAKLRDSRIRSTRLLAQTLSALRDRPRVMVAASAQGVYGAARGDEPLTEASSTGTGFLAELVADWEAAADPAREAGVRVVHVRSGLVLSGRGGLLKVMLIPFRLGLGGKLGSGEQYMSWIAIDDEVGAIVHALHHDDVAGPVNLTAPEPVTNAAFTRTLGEVLGRPTFIPVPALAMELALGAEMARETALAGQRVLPAKLEASGYRFRFPELEPALRHVLDR